jgi:hypothetical protein
VIFGKRVHRRAAKAGATMRALIVRPNLKLLTLFAVLPGIALVGGCGGKDTARGGVAEVPQCRQAADAVTTSDFDTRASLLRMRADAYSDCMQERGYVLDEEELDRRLLHKEQVKNGDPLGGDPAPFLALYRQELRMNPALWRAGAH